MAISHAQAGEVIDIRPLADKFSETKTHTLLKTEQLEVLRLVLPAGKVIAQHKAPSDITVQCLEGSVKFTAPNGTQTLQAGDLLFLKAAELHALEAVSDSSLLVTLLPHHKSE
jgi:quercetin dioxygenase-like cupin family protein